MNDLCRQLLRPAGNLLVVAALICPTAPDAHATTTTRLSVAEMVAAADAIIIGQASSAESVWVGRNLYTRYRVEVQESLLGAGSREVTVVVPGGVDMKRPHPIAVVIADAPVLRRDESVALLLMRSNTVAQGDFSIVGFNQGRIDLNGRAAERATASQRTAATKASAHAARLNQLRTQLLQLIADRGQRSATAPGAAPGARATPGAQVLPNAGMRRQP